MGLTIPHLDIAETYVPMLLDLRCPKQVKILLFQRFSSSCLEGGREDGGGAIKIDQKGECMTP